MRVKKGCQCRQPRGRTVTNGHCDYVIDMEESAVQYSIGAGQASDAPKGANPGKSD